MSLPSESIFVIEPAAADQEMSNESALVVMEAAAAVQYEGEVQSSNIVSNQTVCVSNRRRRLNRSPIVMDRTKLASLEARLLKVNGGNPTRENLTLERLQDQMAQTPPPVSLIVDERRPLCSTESYEAALLAQSSSSDVPSEARKLEFSPAVPGVETVEWDLLQNLEEKKERPNATINGRWDSTGRLGQKTSDPRKSTVGNKVRAMLKQLKKRSASVRSPAQEPSSEKRLDCASLEIAKEEAIETPSSPDRDESSSSVPPPLNVSRTPLRYNKSTDESSNSGRNPNRKSQMMDISLVLEEISEMHGEGSTPLEESCATLLTLKERLDSRLSREENEKTRR